MSSELAIKVSNLQKNYQVYSKPQHRLLQYIYRGRRSFYTSHFALKDVSFEVHQGETLGIIGVNGSGKSTLLQIIAGTLKQTSGSYEVNGRVAALLELGAGFNPEFTGIDNIKLSGQLYGLSEQEVNAKLEDIISFSGIGEFINHEVKTYSSGMFVRLAFAVIAHLDPKILIVDEALSVGDFIFQQKCARYMRETLSGVTKIIVSHDLGTIASMADRVLVLSKGEVAYIGDTKAGIAAYQRIARASAEGREIAAIDNKQMRPGSYTASDYNSWLGIRNDQLSGTGRAAIERTHWLINGEPYAKTIRKEESLCLEFIIRTDEVIENPIFGYQIQDRHGLVIFGENTLSSAFPTEITPPGRYRVTMSVTWPQVAPGEYGVTLGLGNGYASTAHVVECWAHNVITLSSVETDPVHGIFNKKIDSFELHSMDSHEQL